MPNEEKYIYIFTADVPAKAPAAAFRRGLKDVVEKAKERGIKTAVSTIQGNMRAFLQGLDEIISASPTDVGGLTLEEVEVHAQIDGKGNVGISGIVGAEIAMQGGIKFVLRKKI
jgi:hypothetical protein